jgi:hypothetical protein
MLSSEAKAYVGQIVQVEYADKAGNIYIQNAELYDIGFLPLYGPCLILDIGEVRLDRVQALRPVKEAKTAA